MSRRRWRCEQEEMDRLRMEAVEERVAMQQERAEMLRRESVERLEASERARKENEKQQIATEALCHLPKLEKGEDIANFIECFEQSLRVAEVPSDMWARYLPDVLTGKAKDTYCASVPVESRDNYSAIKTILLDSLSKPPAVYVSHCFGWKKPFKATPGEVVSKVISRPTKKP